MLPLEAARKVLGMNDKVVDVVHISEAVSRIGLSEAYSLGYPIFDDAMRGGARAGDLIVVTGISGHGKTTLLQNFTVNLSAQMLPTLFFSFEVITDNLYCKFQEMSEEGVDHLVYVPRTTQSGNLVWIKEMILQAIEKFNIKFIAIDHIDFLSPMLEKKASEQRRIVLREICQDLKTIALELNITIFLVAHVKKVEGREVELQDIAEASGIYQISDFVFSIARKSEPFYEDKIKKFKLIENRGIIKMLKNRLTGQMPEMTFSIDSNIITPWPPTL